MTPDNEGNSVDPPALTQGGSGPLALPCPSLTPNSADSSMLQMEMSSLNGDSVDPPLPHMGSASPISQNNAAQSLKFPSHANGNSGVIFQQRVVESSRTETSRQCYQSISNGNGTSTEVSSVVKESRDDRTCVSVSAAPVSFLSGMARETIGDGLRSQTSFPSTRMPSSPTVSKDTHGSLGRSFLENQTTSTSVSVSVDQRVTVCTNSNFQQQQQQVIQTSRAEEMPSKPAESQMSSHALNGFCFETSDVACRLRPQLTSSYLTKELGPSPVHNEVENILRKYGIETRKYTSPFSTPRPYTGSGDVYRPQSSCRSSSMLNTTTSFGHLPRGSSYTSVPLPPPPINVSQNNEALNKLSEPNSSSMSQSTALPQPPSQGVSSNLPLEYLSSATPVPPQAIEANDTSMNNDTQDETRVATAVDLKAHHGSSVDIVVAADTGAPAPTSTLSNSALRGTTTAMGYQTGYGSSRVYSGGYSVSSKHSNMDASPFEGMYLKNHLSTSRYSSSTRLSGMMLNDPSSSIRDYTSTLGTMRSGYGSVASDKLGYSLLQERQRLRHIDNLITSGPSRTSKPYMAIHSTHSPNSSGTTPGMSRVNSAGTSVGGSTPDTPGVQSYDSPDDIDTIRRAGSSVDTGQFNNNRIGHNAYSPAVVQQILSRMEPQPMQSKYQHGDRGQLKKTQSKPTHSYTAAKKTQLRVSGNPRASTEIKRVPVSQQQKKVPVKTSVKKNGNCTGSNMYYRQGNSYSNGVDGFELARQLNFAWRQAIEQNFSNDDEEHCYSEAVDNPRHAKTINESRENGSLKAKSTTSLNTTPKPTGKKPQRMCKYQPYTPRALKEEHSCQEETLPSSADVENVASCECQNMSHTSPPSEVRCAWQDTARDRERERCLIAATAFASGLIEKRQLQQQRLQHFNGGPGCCSQPVTTVAGKKKVKPSVGGGRTLVTRPATARQNATRTTKAAARPKSSRPVGR